MELNRTIYFTIPYQTINVEQKLIWKALAI